MNDSADLGPLLHAAFRALRSSWTQELAPWELTPHQWRCMRLLQHDDGIRAKDLADKLRIAARSVTEVVDQLQDKGLVSRQPDPTDRRAVRIELTAKGREVSDAVHAVRRERAEEFFGTLTDAERAELARLLTKVAEPRQLRPTPRTGP